MNFSVTLLIIFMLDIHGAWHGTAWPVSPTSTAYMHVCIIIIRHHAPGGFSPLLFIRSLVAFFLLFLTFQRETVISIVAEGVLTSVPRKTIKLICLTSPSALFPLVFCHFVCVFDVETTVKRTSLDDLRVMHNIRWYISCCFDDKRNGVRLLDRWKGKRRLVPIKLLFFISKRNYCTHKCGPRIRLSTFNIDIFKLNSINSYNYTDMRQLETNSISYVILDFSPPLQTKNIIQ